MLTFEKILSDEQIKQTAALANEIWHQHFSGIISDGQIDYMVKKFQSYESLKSQIEAGYEYYGFFIDGSQAGYFGICEKPDNTLFLSKLYLKKEYRGRGYASKAFDFIRNIGRKNGNTMVWLTVNKHNDPTIEVYKHWGMEIIRTEVTDIGNGYVMDDYVFGLEL